jgi:hypothetical protein
MKRFAIPALAALALAGCNNEPSVSLTNTSLEEASRQAAAAGVVSQIKPGQWETKVDLTEFDMAGMTPEMKAQSLEKAKQGQNTHSYCVTAEEAKKPGAGLFTGEANNRCTYRKFEMAGGKVDIVMACPGQGGAGEMTMAVKGDFGPEAVTATTEMKSQGKFAMVMKARVTSRRTGACAAPAKG